MVIEKRPTNRLLMAELKKMVGCFKNKIAFAV